jgi:ComF family protein
LNGFDAAYAFGSYEGKLRKLVHLFKYDRIETLARPLARLALTAFPREERFDFIVPMPLHWTRRWRRGFNQAELLAREIGRRTGLPVKKVVRRRRATPSQARLTNSQRRSNMAGAFQTRSSADLRNRRVLLVDDVLTTGATASACAAVMKHGGAEYVAVLALSRTDRRHETADDQSAAEAQSLRMGST